MDHGEVWSSFTISHSRCWALCHRLHLLMIAMVDTDVKSSSLCPLRPALFFSLSSPCDIVGESIYWSVVYLLICFPNAQMSVLMFMYPNFSSARVHLFAVAGIHVASARTVCLYISACHENRLTDSGHVASNLFWMYPYRQAQEEIYPNFAHRLSPHHPFGRVILHRFFVKLR